MTADLFHLGIKPRLARGVRVQAIYDREGWQPRTFVMRMIRVTENDEAVGTVCEAPFDVPFRLGDEVQVPLRSIEFILGH